jgi:hypothetical protein
MKITPGGPGGRVGTLRSPMGTASQGLIKKGTLKPKINPNTICEDCATGAARVRSAQTGGKVVKPF